MNNYKTIKYLGGLVGCMSDDTERVNNLADADWLTRKITTTYRDAIMGKVLGKFHKAASFVISLDTYENEPSMEVKSAALNIGGLWGGDNSIEGDPKEYAKEILKEILGIDTLEANTPEEIRSIMAALERDIPEIRKYYDF